MVTECVEQLAETRSTTTSAHFSSISCTVAPGKEVEERWRVGGDGRNQAWTPVTASQTPPACAPRAVWLHLCILDCVCVSCHIRTSGSKASLFADWIEFHYKAKPRHSKAAQWAGEKWHTRTRLCAYRQTHTHAHGAEGSGTAERAQSVATTTCMSTNRKWQRKAPWGDWRSEHTGTNIQTHIHTNNVWEGEKIQLRLLNETKEFKMSLSGQAYCCAFSLSLCVCVSVSIH